ncbi:hypothetical protein T11_10623 [Trichinella zimbabwensis]|uniref:Uncharacterized protein n=1 Tax=Trichinella zimbabwensis TaxID=268475 RepID=A0A0V1HV20_9BILA|nr:hypothetical protein T11_10623 [Trichinella zimbabwensis]
MKSERTEYSVVPLGATFVWLRRMGEQLASSFSSITEIHTLTINMGNMTEITRTRSTCTLPRSVHQRIKHDVLDWKCEIIDDFWRWWKREFMERPQVTCNTYGKWTAYGTWKNDSLKSFIPEYDIVVFFSVDLTPRALSFMADDHRFMDNLWIAEDENHRVPTSGTMRFNILCLNDKNNRQLVA